MTRSRNGQSRRSGIPFTLRRLGIGFLLVITAALAPALLAGDAVRVEVLSDVGTSIVLDYRIDQWQLDPVTVGTEEYVQVRLPGEAILQERGAPALPQVSRSVVIPDDARMEVRVLSFRYEDTLARVVPSKGTLPRTVDPDGVSFTFGEAYGTDAFYPEAVAELGEPYIMRDWRGAVVRVHPFRYNPVTRVLRVYTQITLEVVAVGPGEKNVLDREAMAQRPVRSFEELYRSRFLNYPTTPRYALIDEEGDMLVIAHDPWIGNLDAFVTHKASMGVTATVVGVSTIGNDSASIKSYIQSIYDTSNLAFVLLVGDAAEVATPLRQVGAEQGAADPLYSKLAGDDHYPEIMVGRFSAQTAAELDTQVERTIEYETAPALNQDWFLRGVGIASSQGAGIGDEGQSDRVHMDEIRGWLMADGYDPVDQVYDPGASDTQVANAVNAGRGIINYTGHGSSSGWGTSGFNTADVDALNNDNMLPFIVSVACNNGEFHHYAKCFAEAWLRATDDITGEPTGAIGMYASSVLQSWAPPMEAQDEFNLRLTDPAKPYRSLGAMCFAGSSSMMDQYGPAGVEMFDTWILFGDPSLRIAASRGLEITPGEGLTASGPAGGPYDVTSIEYTLTNHEAEPLDWTASADAPWIVVNPPLGTIPAEGTESVTVSLEDDSCNLDNGDWTELVHFVNATNHRGDTIRPVTVAVGASTMVHRWDLEVDPGWNREGEWAYGVPTGGGGGQGLNPDPTSGATGATVLGAALDGNISKRIGGPYYLTAGPMDLTGCTAVSAGFQRWLNTRGPPDMSATVDVSADGVSWTPVWTLTGVVADAAWSQESLDLSAVADDGASVYVRWGYQVVDRVPQAGSGWNLDDVVIEGRPGTARTVLRVEPGGLAWDEVPGTVSYDVVSGDLGALIATGGDFSQATRACLADDLAATWLDETAVPAPGEGTWFLVRGVSLGGPLTWQCLEPAQVGLRDAEIQGSGVACP